MTTLIRLAIFLGALMLAGGPAAAFKMTPIEIRFDPAGAGASQTILLENQTQAPAAVELTTHKRDMSPDGDDILQADEDSFLVVPSQIILMPGQQQVVRVQWLGGPVGREAAYRLIAEQLPVDLDTDSGSGGRMRLLVRYIASLYVTPKGATPEIAIRDARIERGQAHMSELRFKIANAGNAHVGLSDLTITVRPDGPGTKPALRLPPPDLDGVTGAVVLANRDRNFRIPLPKALPPGPAHVDLDYTAR